MNVKFEIRFINSPWEPAGAISKDGAIKINWNFCRNPAVFISVFLHEAAHWLLDAIGCSYNARVHYWLDLLHSYIGVYGRKVNRKKLRHNLPFEENEK